MASTLDLASEALAQAAGLVDSVADDARAAAQLLAVLGWAPPPGAAPLVFGRLDLAGLLAALDGLTEARSRGADAAEQALAAGRVAVALAGLFDAIDATARGFQATPDYLAATNIVDEFLPRLGSVIAIQALGARLPLALPLGLLLGVFELRAMPADAAHFQVEHVRQTVHWDRIGTLFSDPASLPREVYGWGTPAFDAHALIANLSLLFDGFAVASRVRRLPRPAEELLAGRPVPEADSAPAQQLLFSLDKGLGDDPLDVGLSLFPLRPTQPGGSDGGLGLAPYAFGTTETRFPLSQRLALVLDASIDLAGGVALLLRAGQDPAFRTGLLRPASGPPAGTLTLSLRHEAAGNEAPHTLLSLPGVTLEARALSIGLGIEVGSSVNPAIAARLEGGRLRIVPDGSGDGFLSSVLPADGASMDLDLGLSWSPRDGVRFEGGGGLKTGFALNRQLGPLRIERVDLGIAPEAGALRLDATFGASVKLGPVTVSATGVGTSVALRFERGNLGPVDLGASLRAPDGLGLALDAQGVVTGGGFLFADRPNAQYGGVLQLTVHDSLTVKAIGLLSTRLPDGRPGFSLLVLLTVEDFRPIPLGMGFTLQALGGLLGVNRRVDDAVLGEGLKNGTLGSVLFPKDPLRNAAQIVRTLSAVFPAQPGNHLFGPMVRIGWATPTLIRFELALILEFGRRRRLVVLGRVSSILPSPDNDLVRLNLDAVGIVDFDEGTASLDAVLVDSRLAHKFALTGAMAMRMRWTRGPGAGFALAVGGLNPHFAPPAGLPRLDRLTIHLASGDNPRIVCEAYFAITSNTVQFGARALLHASAHGFSIDGDVGFDVLVQLLPFHFLADFHASVQLKRGSHNLFKVKVAGSLEGPRPLRVSAKATFEILWCDVSVRFDKTLVAGEPPPLPPAVDALAELQRALADPGRWSTAAAAGRTHGVALRKRPAGAQGLFIDPLATLSVRQTVLPLNTGRDLDLFGGAPIAGARRFEVTGATLGGRSPGRRLLDDQFASAQYFAMSDDEKLASPSFEPLVSGVEFVTDAVTLPEVAAQRAVSPLEYDNIVVDAAGVPEPPRRGYVLRAASLFRQARSAAVADAPVRRSGRARFAAEAPDLVALGTPRYAIVSTDDLGTPLDGDTARPWGDARAAWRALERRDPAAAGAWQVVPLHELAD